MTEDQAIVLGYNLIRKYLGGSSRQWSIELDRSGQRVWYGICCPQYQTIFIADWYAVSATKEDLAHTYRHEIAHALVANFDFTKPDPDGEHGPRWLHAARELNVDTSRYEHPI